MKISHVIMTVDLADWDFELQQEVRDKIVCLKDSNSDASTAKLEDDLAYKLSK